MSVAISGIVKNGVIIPSGLLPENAAVEIHLLAPNEVGQTESNTPIHMTPSELRKLPREQRQAILAAAAELAEEDYRADKELTGFDAFSEEEVDGDAN